MIEGRFHVASLVALFCALGTGILIGGALTDNDSVRAQQQLWMDNIEADVTALRAEKDALLADLHYAAQLLAFGDTVMADVAARALAGSLADCVIALEPAPAANNGDDALLLLLRQLGALVVGSREPTADNMPSSADERLQHHVRIVRSDVGPAVGQWMAGDGSDTTQRLVLGVPGAPTHTLLAQLKLTNAAVVPFADTAAGQWRLVMTVLDTGCGDEA